MLTLQDTASIRRIESAIGYTFRDKRLLVQVFTRKTYMRLDPEAPDNEVLEFYGDMLMSYHVTTYFVEKFAHMLNDGLYFMRTVEQFTEMRSHYVRNQYLTERIKQLIPNIDRLVRAQNPRVELPKDNQKAYADLFESMIGAVYLDSYQNNDLIRAFILRHLNIEPKVTETATRQSSRTVVLPSVSLLDHDSDDSRTDVIAEEPLDPVESPLIDPLAWPNDAGFVPPMEEPVDAMAAPIEAPVPEKHRSATAARNPSHLKGKLRVTPVAEETPVHEESPTPDSPPAEVLPSVETETLPAPDAPTENQNALAAFCEEAGYEAPIYSETPKNAPNARPVAACTVRFRNRRGKPVKISLNDSGKTLAEATEKAAAKMLRKLKEQMDADAAQPTAEPTPVAEPAGEIPPMTEVPAAESPVVEAPAVHDSVVETSAMEAHNAGTPEAEVAPVEVPVAEIPVIEAAVTEVPVIEIEVTDAPVVETPVAEASALETLAKEMPAVETAAEGKPRGRKSAKKATPDAAQIPAEKKTARRSTKKAVTAANAEASPAAADTPVEILAEVPPETPVEAPAKPIKASAKPRRRTPAKTQKIPEGDTPAE